jgi:hypothetical protein
MINVNEQIVRTHFELKGYMVRHKEKRRGHHPEVSQISNPT